MIEKIKSIKKIKIMGTSAEREVLAIPVVEMCSGEKELQVAIIKKWPYCNKD